VLKLVAATASGDDVIVVVEFKMANDELLHMAVVVESHCW